MATAVTTVVVMRCNQRRDAVLLCGAVPCPPRPPPSPSLPGSPGRPGHLNHPRSVPHTRLAAHRSYVTTERYNTIGT